MRTAGGSVTLADLTAQALVALQAAGLDFERLALDAGFRRKPGHDHLRYVADTGVGRNGQPWMMVIAGNAKVTGDVSTLLVVYRRWEAGRAMIDPAEAADIQRQIKAASAPSSGQRQPCESERARPA
jgi:hypothetical protein